MDMLIWSFFSVGSNSESRPSFWAEIGEKMYIAVDDQNEASVDIDVHACSGGES